MAAPQTWSQMFWKMTSLFALNYVTCVATVHVTGNVLCCVLPLICYILAAKFRNECESVCTSKGQQSRDILLEELKAIDKDKQSFVIERFVEMNRKMEATKNAAKIFCESERCVVCLEEKAEIQTLPCRHRVTCGFCAWSTFKMALQKSALHTCVVCRAQIRDFNGSLFNNLVHVTSQDIKTILDETKKCK